MRSALTGIGATDIDATNRTNPPSVTFSISEDMDIDAKLNELAEKTSELQGWTKK